MLLLDTGPTEGYLNKAEFYLSTIRVCVSGGSHHKWGVCEMSEYRAVV